MDDILVTLAVAAAALLGFTIAGFGGVGGAVITLPVLIWALGARDAIPILAVSQLIAASARVAFNRRDIAWPVVRWFSVGVIPSSALGSVLFVATPTAVLTRVVGVLMLLIAVYPLTPWGRRTRVPVRWFMPVGAGTGLLSGLVGVIGPFLVPFYLGYGLLTSAYVGTSSVNVLTAQLPRLVILGSNDLLGPRTLLIGVAIGLVAILGAYLGRQLVTRVPYRLFPPTIEGILVVSGVLFIVRG